MSYISPFRSAKKYTLSKASIQIGGKVLRDCSFSGQGMFKTPDRDFLTVLFDEKYLPDFQTNLANISGVICNSDMASHVPDDMGCLVHNAPLDAFFNLQIYFCENEREFLFVETENRIHASAFVHPSAVIADKNVIIESDAVIEANVVVMPYTYIGENSYIGPNSTLGARGFEVRTINGKQQYIPHASGTHIGSNCQLNSNNAIPQGLFSVATTLEDDVIMDSFAMVAHGSYVGERTKMGAASVICGSSVVGKDVWIGPQAVVSNALKIGDNARIMLGARCMKDLPEGAAIGGPFSVRLPPSR